jgi:hypothetical protein
LHLDQQLVKEAIQVLPDFGSHLDLDVTELIFEILVLHEMHGTSTV